MKRYNYLFLLIAAAFTMALASCDDDDDWYYDDWYGGNHRQGNEHNNPPKGNDIDFVRMAQTLAGDWHGTTTATFQDSNGKWQTAKYYTEINFTLLGGIGDILLNQHLSKQQVFDSFDSADAFARRTTQEEIDICRRDSTWRRYTASCVRNDVQRAREHSELRHYEYYNYDGHRWWVSVKGC